MISEASVWQMSRSELPMLYGEEYGISVDSEYEEGTTVTVRIPIQ